MCTPFEIVLYYQIIDKGSTRCGRSESLHIALQQRSNVASASAIKNKNTQATFETGFRPAVFLYDTVCNFQENLRDTNLAKR